MAFTEVRESDHDRRVASASSYEEEGLASVGEEHLVDRVLVTPVGLDLLEHEELRAGQFSTFQYVQLRRARLTSCGSPAAVFSNSARPDPLRRDDGQTQGRLSLPAPYASTLRTYDSTSGSQEAEPPKAIRRAFGPAKMPRWVGVLLRRGRAKVDCPKATGECRARIERQRNVPRQDSGCRGSRTHVHPAKRPTISSMLQT